MPVFEMLKQTVRAGYTGAGVRAHEHRQSAVEAQAEWRHRVAASHPLDLRVDADAIPSAGVAGPGRGTEAGLGSQAREHDHPVAHVRPVAVLPCHHRLGGDGVRQRGPPHCPVV